MVDNLQAAFDRLTEKYMHRLSSSDEEIAVEYQLPTPSRKHKLKSSESPNQHKRKKRKSQSDSGIIRNNNNLLRLSVSKIDYIDAKQCSLVFIHKYFFVLKLSS